jgi:RNA polymerase sigma factor (sigma-70 family)
MDDNAYRDMDDAELVRREREAIDGDDRWAYGELFRRYGRLVYIVCRGILYRAGVRLAQDARDLAQETFMRGLRDLATLNNPGAFGHWICAIARNVCRNWLALHDNQNRNLSPSDPEPPGRPEAVSPDELLDLTGALDKLPEDLQLAMRMCLDGCSHKEIADWLGVKRPTVNTWLRKARQQLRDDLNPPEDDSDL